MKVLVTGGAGYIGSHTVREFIKSGHEVVVLDNLSTGNKPALPRRAIFFEGNTSDSKILESIFSNHQIDVVVHCSAKLIVPESVKDPIAYFENNVGGVIALLSAMRQHQVDKFVFSSTAAVYGNPEKIPAKEDDHLAPINPYGASKLACEWLIKSSLPAYGIKYAIFRYFNVAGADPDRFLGQSTKGSKITHLVPIVVDAAIGNIKKLMIYGDDYQTPDGTCIRDYIHVSDLARAHVVGASFVDQGKSDIFNLGSQTGYSVKQVLETAERVLGKKIPHEIAPRRPGDPAVLVADVTKARTILGFKNEFTLEDMIKSDYEWRVAPKF